MIEIKYKCRCMKAEAAVFVVPRDPARNVVEWIEGPVMSAVGYDHTTRSPFCRAEKLDYLKLPVNEQSQAIGAKPTPN